MCQFYLESARRSTMETSFITKAQLIANKVSINLIYRTFHSSINSAKRNIQSLEQLNAFSQSDEGCYN